MALPVSLSSYRTTSITANFTLAPSSVVWTGDAHFLEYDCELPEGYRVGELSSIRDQRHNP